MAYVPLYQFVLTLILEIASVQGHIRKMLAHRLCCCLPALPVCELGAEFPLSTRTSFLVYTIPLKPRLPIPPEFHLPFCIYSI